MTFSNPIPIHIATITMKSFKFSALAIMAAAALMVATPAEASPQPAFMARQEPGGQSRMSQLNLMGQKQASRERCRSEGLCGKFGVNERRAGPRAFTCTNGKAGEYPCKNVNLLDMLTHNEMQSFSANGGGEGSDVWGWEYNGREFGIVTQTDGTAFVEINVTTGAMRFLGRLPTQTTSALWRDAKVIGNYVYIGSEATGHGIQIFDLRKLLNVSTPQTFKADAVHTAIGSSHNIINSADPNVIIACGQKSCSGGLYFVNVANPLSPQYIGCYSGDGYTHDAQCVTYNGPDSAYKGREICFAYNEDTLTILDVTDKRAVKQLSRTPYVGSAYTHQGWLTSSSHTHLLLDDELDEESQTSTAADGHTRTYVWNVSKLTKPVQEGIYRSPVTSIDHNQYVVNGRSYQSNYASGLRIVDVSRVASGGGAASMSEVANFDVRPEDNVVDFYGSWSAYVFKSGKVIVNSIERGAFVVKPTV